MICPSCKAEAKMQGDVLTCPTCGTMTRNQAGEWEPSEAPANPEPSPQPKASPVDKVDTQTPPAAPEPDPDAGLFIEVPL